MRSYFDFVGRDWEASYPIGGIVYPSPDPHEAPSVPVTSAVITGYLQDCIVVTITQSEDPNEIGKQHRWHYWRFLPVVSNTHQCQMSSMFD